MTDNELADELERLWVEWRDGPETRAFANARRDAFLEVWMSINTRERILAALRREPAADEVERVAELQLAAFLAGRGSVTSMHHGTRSAKPAPTMDEFRNMAIAALSPAREQGARAALEAAAKARPEKPETWNYQAAGYTAGWAECEEAKIAAIRQIDPRTLEEG